MGKRHLKTLLLVAIVISIIFIYQNTKPFSLGDIQTAVSSQFDHVKTLLGSNVDQKTTVYSTRDETGVIEFSDSLPTDNTNTKSITIDSNANLIPAVPVNKKMSVKNEHSAKDSFADISPITPYTDPGKIKQLLNDTKNIQDSLNNRKTNLDKQLNDL